MRIFSRRLLPVAAAAAAMLPGALPAHAANGANFGSGVATVTANFINGGLPLFNAGCIPVNFYLVNGSATGVIANTVETTFEGSVPLNGMGSDPCAFLDREQVGAISINSFSVKDDMTNSTINCPGGLTGTYTRVGTHVQVDIFSPLGSDCTINGWASGRVHFIAEGEFAPTSGDGVFNRVTSGSFAGAFAVED